MDAKLRDDLFKKYVQSLERRLDEGDDDARRYCRSGDSSLLPAVSSFLGAYQADPANRFRVVRFYEMAENALITLRSSSLKGLETAFCLLETFCTNLLLFPWKKEYRCIKTFTGPYVYHLQSALCESDLRSLLRSMGYFREELQYGTRDSTGGSLQHMRQLAFELFLAQAECRLLAEMVEQAGGVVSELEVLDVRRDSREDAVGCAEALRCGDAPVGQHRGYPRKSGRASRSVDVTDGAGHWHQASKPVLKASLSLRKEPLFVDAEEEEPQDEIIRPSTSLLSAAPLSSYSPVADFFPTPSSPPEQYQYHLPSLDEIDLYTERGISRHTTPRPPSRGLRENWALKSPSLCVKCQGCGLPCSHLTSCHKGDLILCPACHALDPSPCCGMQDYPPADGYASLKEKPLMSSKLYPGKATVSGFSGSRCGFCNKPAASHTCMSCSKVSCDACVSLYAGDACSRKNLHHNFVSNHQLDYKSGSTSHLVYR